MYTYKSDRESYQKEWDSYISCIRKDITEDLLNEAEQDINKATCEFNCKAKGEDFCVC